MSKVILNPNFQIMKRIEVDHIDPLTNDEIDIDLTKTHRLHLSTPIVNNCKIYESNDDDVREVCDYSECNSSTGIDSTSEEIDMQSDGDDEIEITREGERWNSIINDGSTRKSIS
ncbi:2195_t:CDS:2 [Entrophospora sp. SA101]|nr:938_t:CDS:2 [Entrophospora sp. SA101]CAJ0833086.1 2195_t:CDS:2 [Entrophospora sp. SA101]